jgi:biotin carboxyl carrier protein
MDIPSSYSGNVKEVKIKVGDIVAKGFTHFIIGSRKCSQCPLKT